MEVMSQIFVVALDWQTLGSADGITDTSQITTRGISAMDVYGAALLRTGSISRLSLHPGMDLVLKGETTPGNSARQKHPYNLTSSTRLG